MIATSFRRLRHLFATPNPWPELIQDCRHYELGFEPLSDMELATRLAVIRAQLIQQAGDDNSWHAEVAALGAEAIRRTLGFRLHDVQLFGALATAAGAIIEMRTGEGKTVVCGLAALIRSAQDLSVHVATTSDYLAERDHATLAPAFNLLETSSGVLRRDAHATETRHVYAQRITYGPGYLFGFDYLRDQIQLQAEEQIVLGRHVLQAIDGRDPTERLLQHLHQTIIVDEADSVLIDEATTPLILSGQQEHQPAAAEAYVFATDVARLLEEVTDYEATDNGRRIRLTRSGHDRVHAALRERSGLLLLRPWTTYVENALYAMKNLQRDEHYVVTDQKVRLVDQYTGRLFDDRTLRNGLHQAVEAKEQLEIQPPNRAMAQITRQQFFKLYDRVCGMTGTASGSESELGYFYQTHVVSVPSHQPNQRHDHPTRFFRDDDSKIAAIVNDAIAVNSLGRPILLGTRTIHDSREVAQALATSGLKCTVLNGVQDEEESDVIAQAGLPGAVTVATNMAGRGTDIKLTAAARTAGGLHVIGTERHLSRRVDLQLAGRAARQGDPGSSRFYVSADDDLLAQHSPELASRLRQHCDEYGESFALTDAEVAQLQQRLEKQQFEVRRMLVQRDNWLNKVRESLAAE
ncbi:MAG: hypothetical protein KDA92_04210 [Planctomycetales bacterium]|nr:hypothetical protein [Planctomycetales bacterium]